MRWSNLVTEAAYVEPTAKPKATTAPTATPKPSVDFFNWGTADSSSSMTSYAKDLSLFAWRRVATGGRGALVFQKAPRGKAMTGHSFYDGDWIYVNVSYRKEGYAVAYENGEYGYVDASYIDWSDTGSSTIDARDLSAYEWRQVATRGRGALVFQTAPGGKGMKGHSFTDGDWIYVNVDYWENGYTMAYEDGEYGYVDASYIDW